jgi:hypothetical protein
VTFSLTSPPESAARALYRRALLRVATSVLVASAAIACGGGTEPGAGAAGPTAVYVGRLDGTDARVALVRDDVRWAAYVCGGPSTLSSMTGWFQGEMGPASRDGDVEAQASGKLLRATFAEARAMGSFVAGTEVVFEAERVPAGMKTAGLFQLHSRGCRSGLVVPPPGEGDPQGVYCANLDDAGNAIPAIYAQVNPLLPLTLTDHGIASQVAGETGTIYLSPVVLPLP